jgi:hypothetical protein
MTNWIRLSRPRPVACLRECSINIIFNDNKISIGNNTFITKLMSISRISLSKSVFNYLSYPVTPHRNSSFTSSHINPLQTESGDFGISLAVAIINYNYAMHSILSTLRNDVFNTLTLSPLCVAPSNDDVNDLLMHPFFSNIKVKDLISLSNYVISTPYNSLPAKIRNYFNNNNAKLYNSFTSILILFNNAFLDCSRHYSNCFVLPGNEVLTRSPTLSPTPPPYTLVPEETTNPSTVPTCVPTIPPPTQSITIQPSEGPTHSPSLYPTSSPTTTPTPTPSPTSNVVPTNQPSVSPPPIYGNISVCNCTYSNELKCNSYYVSVYQKCIHQCGTCINKKRDSACENTKNECISTCFSSCIDGPYSPPCTYCTEVVAEDFDCFPYSNTITIPCTM